MELLPSSYDCPHAVLPGALQTRFRTCTFQNLYLWRGKAYFIVPGEAPRLLRHTSCTDSACRHVMATRVRQQALNSCPS